MEIYTNYPFTRKLNRANKCKNITKKSHLVFQNQNQIGLKQRDIEMKVKKEESSTLANLMGRVGNVNG